MKSELGRKLHAQAEHAREDGKLVSSLGLVAEAEVAYGKDHDPAGFAEVLASRYLALIHLHDQTGDINFLIDAKYTIMASVEIAEKSGDIGATALPLFNRAKVEERLNELKAAISSYEQAIEVMKTNPPERHNRPGVIADMENHLAVAELKNGDQAAEQRALDAIEKLKNTDEPQFTKDVWRSGGFMRLATVTKNKEYLNQAKEIIDSNPELILRKGQWEKLAKELS